MKYKLFTTNRGKINFWLLLVVFSLVVLGTIMVYSAVDLSIFLLDFINNFLIYLNLAIIKFIIRKKTPKAANILEY